MAEKPALEQIYFAPLEGSVLLKMRSVSQVRGEGAGGNHGLSNQDLDAG